jgi:hypothetical protein
MSPWFDNFPNYAFIVALECNPRPLRNSLLLQLGHDDSSNKVTEAREANSQLDYQVDNARSTLCLAYHAE